MKRLATPCSVAITEALSEKGSTFSRSYRSLGMQVHGIDKATRRSWLGSRKLTSFRQFSARDSDEQKQENLFHRLREINPDVFLPLDTETSRWCVHRRAELPSGCHTLLPPATSYEAAYDKVSCLDACRQMSIPVPFSFTAEEAVDWFQRGGGRLVIKPRVDLGAARGLGFAQSEKELEIALEQCRHSCPDVTIQEYIPGGSESYCSLTVLFDQQSRLIAASTYRKLLTWPLSGGLSAIGLSSYQPELLELMLPLFRHWRWVGAAEVEFRVDERDGRPKVFEINPRVPGYVLFQVYSGIDYPKLALTAAWDHEQLPEIEQLSSYRVGVKNINPGRAIAAARSLTASQGLVRGLSQFGRLARGGLPFVAHQAHYPDDIWLRHLNRE